MRSKQAQQKGSRTRKFFHKSQGNQTSHEKESKGWILQLFVRPNPNEVEVQEIFR